ncbi:DCC1-like thiol-disulfide oxidoreductase family protein [Thalassotalea fonticola]|uniref:DCC1-like thiol-disulfide oxidoreductase family protein n=1 Tax=Thalassotalea fonticola TaxID=3065649 RepID=A0ABZ0GSW2_9GAMM|nr:DCC1-like thiol-disulfide oxidoreductase family protein [Colwelliaceae bacterium S1-1]
MKNDKQFITVFYDADCPECVTDRRFYERLAGQGGKQVKWLDITGQDDYLKSLGIDPLKALTELHVQLANGKILSELDAYIILMNRVWLLKSVAWLISLTFIRPYLARWYHARVEKRLKATGRL